MQISQELLKRYQAPPLISSVLKKRFGTSAKVEDLIEFLEPTEINWLLIYLPLSEEEVSKILSRLQIEDSSIIYNSFDIKDSQNIVDSAHIKNSNYIISCDTVVDSTLCVNSKNCEKSSFLYNSEFCTSTNYSVESKSCDNSSNLIKSIMCLRSNDLFNCNNVVDSAQLVNCDKVRNSYFSVWCSKLHFSFFCSKVQGEYLLFNESFDKELYDMIHKQYLSLVEPLEFVKKWPTTIDPFEIPTYTFNYKKYYSKQTNRFWDWVKTLPNYNPKILYEITCLPRFLV